MPRKRKDRGDPISASTDPTTIIMSNLWKVSLQQATQSGMMTMLGLLKSGTLILRCTSDRGNPLSPLGERRESQSSFSHDKTKHVILEEEETHDRPGQPVVIPQRGARLQQFAFGNDETESELSADQDHS